MLESAGKLLVIQVCDITVDYLIQRKFFRSYGFPKPI